MSEANGTAALTLGAGTVPVTFRAMRASDMLTVRATQEQQRRRVLAEFPALKELQGKGPAFLDHPDYPRYSGLYEQCVDYYPWLVGAWGVENAAPPTVDAMLASDDAEVMTCMHAVARLNRHRLHEMPAIVEATLPAEETRPN